MAVFNGPHDQIHRQALEVMVATCADELTEIRELWPRFERLVGLRGRKMYATADPGTGVYSTCTAIRSGDDPEELGLGRAHLPGGRFLRGRLRGDPSRTYALIAPGFDELEVVAGGRDHTRPLVEFYKRRDEIEL